MANLRPSPRHEKMRQRILDVAAQSFFQNGYTNTSVRQIAKSTAYSLPKSSTAIHQTITSKWQEVFADYLPNCETTDFYKLEIATCGIMRGFMTVPCDMWFTIDQKVESFLTCTFKLYDVPQKKIREATEFIKQFDFAAMAKKTVKSILQ